MIKIIEYGGNSFGIYEEDFNKVLHFLGELNYKDTEFIFCSKTFNKGLTSTQLHHIAYEIEKLELEKIGK